MEIRRVQMTGGSSYVLTLPKDWVQSLNLKKKDSLGVLVKENGDLLITGNISGESIHRNKLLEIEPGVDTELFFRSLVGSYIAGYNTIEVKSHGRIPSSIRKTVREFSDQVIGLEPVEESDDRIILRDLFNPLEMPIEKSLKRMYTITRSMHTDSIEAIIKGDAILAEDIIMRDQDIDRLFWLISRQTHIILHGPRISNKKYPPFDQVLHYFLTGRIVERIADHAVLITKSVPHINPEGMTGDISSIVEKALKDAVKAFDQSIEAVFSTDPIKANRIIKSVHLHEDTFHTINQEILILPTETALAIRKISDSIRRVSEYSGDIAEEVINYHAGLG